MIIAKSERNEDLRARLVEDPELLQKNIKDLSDSLNNARTMLAAEETKARDLKTRFDWLGSVETVRSSQLQQGQLVDVVEWCRTLHSPPKQAKLSRLSAHVGKKPNKP